MDEFDALDVLDAIEIQVKESPRVPVSHLRAVDRTTLENLVALAREELARGQELPRSALSREGVLAQVEGESRFLIENARHEADELLREERIRVFTRRRFDQIVEEGRERAQRTRQEAYSYGAGRLDEAEKRLHRLSQQVAAGLETLKDSIKEIEKGHQQRKRDEARQGWKRD